MSNAKLSTMTAPLRMIKHNYRHTTTGELLIPTNVTYYSPQNKQHRYSTGSGMPVMAPTVGRIGGGGLGGSPVVSSVNEKRSPVNKNVQQINSEEEASVLSRYPFHGNRAIPSSRTPVVNVEELPVNRGQQRWSLIDVNNNRVEFNGKVPSEVDEMLPYIDEPDKEDNLGGGFVSGGSLGRAERRPKRQLNGNRSHSSRSKIHYKSPPLKRFSNVYDYAYMSDPSLNAIHEDSDDSQ